MEIQKMDSNSVNSLLMSLLLAFFFSLSDDANLLKKLIYGQKANNI